MDKNLEKLSNAKIGKIDVGHKPYYFNEIINSGSIGGRRMNKTMEALQKVDIAIRQKDKFPILYVTKEQTAVVISLEEYKRLKEINIFDGIRESMAKEIGLSKEQLFPNFYGDEEAKKEYREYSSKVWGKHVESIKEIAKKYETKLEELVKKYEKRPKE